MSNLEEVENVNIASILSIGALDERRSKLMEIQKTIDKHEDGLTKYHTSEERIEILNESKKSYTNQIEILEERNIKLSKIIAEQPTILSKFNQYINNIDDLTGSNQFEIPNLKISKISGWVVDTRVVNLKLEMSDSGKRVYGWDIDRSIASQKKNKDVTKFGRYEKVGPFILEPTEFVVKIDKVTSSTGKSLGNAIIFYTSFNRKHIIKGRKIEIDPSKISQEKTFLVNTQRRSIFEHHGIAHANGYTLASIADSGENAKISKLLKQHNLRDAWIGGRRIRNGRGKDSNTWAWLDGSKWNYTSSWNRGEPNDCCGGESFIQVFNSNTGFLIWNDLFHTHPGNKQLMLLPGIYSKKSAKITTNSVTSGGSEMSITGITSLDDMTVEIEEQFSTDTTTLDTLKGLKNDVTDLSLLLEDNAGDYNIEHKDNINMITKLEKLIGDINSEIKAINELNNFGKDGFTNRNRVGDKIISFMNKIFGNSNKKRMIEGMDNSALTSPFYDKLTGLFSETRQSLNSEMAITDRIEYEEERNYMLELISQKDNVLSNVLMDYMVNDTKGSNAEKVYEELDQENRDKLRQIQMNDYKTKTYMEYSSILKFIVILIIIMIPFLLLANYEIMNRDVSLFFVVAIGFIGFVTVLYRMYRVSMKDNKNFDKDIIPYNRESAMSSRNGIKTTGDLGLGITCIGEQCCTDGMSYDSTKNRCFATSENFGNFFENSINTKNQVESTVINNDLHELSNEFTYIKEPFLSSSADLASFKTRGLVDSLNNSSDNKMFKP